MKYFFFCIAILLTFGQFVSCSDSADSPNSPKIEPPSDSLSGMMRVNVTDEPVILGTKDESANNLHKR